MKTIFLMIVLIFLCLAIIVAADCYNDAIISYVDCDKNADACECEKQYAVDKRDCDIAIANNLYNLDVTASLEITKNLGIGYCNCTRDGGIYADFSLFPTYIPNCKMTCDEYYDNYTIFNCKCNNADHTQLDECIDKITQEFINRLTSSAFVDKSIFCSAIQDYMGNQTTCYDTCLNNRGRSYLTETCIIRFGEPSFWNILGIEPFSCGWSCHDFYPLKSTLAPTTDPSKSPTPPTNSPSESPTLKPSLTPTVGPSLSPTRKPSTSPTTKSPTFKPTTSPSNKPTLNPSISPTPTPTSTPTKSPSRSPTDTPTKPPSASPTKSPSKSPTPPTNSPSESPTLKPSFTPTMNPSLSPTRKPSTSPTTKNPTFKPTLNPSISPTPTPTPTKSAATHSPSRIAIAIQVTFFVVYANLL